MTLAVKDAAGTDRDLKTTVVASEHIGHSIPTNSSGTEIAIATAALQTTGNTALADILAKLTADPATQTTLAAILAKIIAAPATEAKQDALAVLVGEVQASPTANTVLDRLKTLATSLPLPTGAATDAGLTTIAGHLDGVETLLTAIDGRVDGLEALTGAVAETAPASDTASSGLNGRLQRIAQRLTSLIALLPASLGAKAAAASLAVTQSTEDAAQLGSLTETAPASDTASSGLNGRLQRVAQRLTSLIAVFTNGAGTAAAAVRTTLASDDPAVTALQLIDNAVSGAGFNITQIGGVDISRSAGGVDTGTQRVTLANTDPAVVALQIIDNAISGNEMQVDVVAALPTGANTIGRVEHTSTGIGHGVTTVTTAGTDVVLAASTPAKMVMIQAQTDNTGIIAVGASGVDATVATGSGVALAAGDSITLPIDNLADIFIDATVNGEGVRYTYTT